MEIVILILFGLIAWIHGIGHWHKAQLINSYSFELSQNSPKISVGVCTHNEKNHLEELIPILLSQTYQKYELIIALDRCTDGSEELARSHQWVHLSFVVIDQLKSGFHPIKYGITQAINRANGKWILLTDADCRPTKNWVTEMGKGMSSSCDLVIGLSPYVQLPGLLNQLIQYETFQTAFQFMANAAQGKPYMALGRNLGYRKASFLENDGFGAYSSDGW